MNNGEVSFSNTRLGWLGFHEVRWLAQMLGLQFFREGLIRGFREHRLFLKDGEDTHGLVNIRKIVVSKLLRSSLKHVPFENTKFTFSISSIQACKSIPKSMKTQSIPSRLYSSCSRTNMWWLKNCWSFSLVKLIHNCSNPLYYSETPPKNYLN